MPAQHIFRRVGSPSTSCSTGLFAERLRLRASCRRFLVNAAAGSIDQGIKALFQSLLSFKFVCSFLYNLDADAFAVDDER